MSKRALDVGGYMIVALNMEFLKFSAPRRSADAAVRAAAEMDMERIIAKSFHQFQHNKALPEARGARCERKCRMPARERAR